MKPPPFKNTLLAVKTKDADTYVDDNMMFDELDCEFDDDALNQDLGHDLSKSTVRRAADRTSARRSGHYAERKAQ